MGIITVTESLSTSSHNNPVDCCTLIRSSGSDTSSNLSRKHTKFLFDKE
ncbi:unnamed protein product [Schistosoma margrebowiei]|uniref:Uncharacterized protein n=1 Tax=Schistosoma margrebowiei TaxID=48269 RepID=A0A183MPU6_9TREM|nr:unnamed protein product [Schistosoma margrebowiei]